MTEEIYLVSLTEGRLDKMEKGDIVKDIPWSLYIGAEKIGTYTADTNTRLWVNKKIAVERRTFVIATIDLANLVITGDWA